MAIFFYTVFILLNCEINFVKNNKVYMFEEAVKCEGIYIFLTYQKEIKKRTYVCQPLLYKLWTIKFNKQFTFIFIS